MKSERLDWLADNPLYTKRFAFFVAGAVAKPRSRKSPRNCSSTGTPSRSWTSSTCASNSAAGTPAPRVIGIDEIAIARGHQYRIVVSDLERGRPIWFGGVDRSEASLDEFFAWLGPEKCGKIRLAVMDMWQAFRNSTLKEGNAPQATICTTSSTS